MMQFGAAVKRFAEMDVEQRTSVLRNVGSLIGAYGSDCPDGVVREFFSEAVEEEVAVAKAS